MNMEMTRNGACNDVGNGTFQVWLFETTGVVELVYGSIPTAATVDGGYSMGFQAGAATNFASITTNGNTVSYTAANNTQFDAIAAGRAYIFTPLIPADPTNLIFSGTTQFATTLNWTDNSSNEVGFPIYRSTDGGATYTFLNQAAANAVSFTDSTVGPGNTYFYRVFSVTEGGLSNNPAAGSVSTLPAGNGTSTAAGGNWSDVNTWVSGTVPTAGDAVVIADGATVTIDVAAVAWSVTVGQGGVPATLLFEPTTARTLTVGSNVAVTTTGLFASAATGTVITHVLSLPGSLTVDGALDFSTNGNTAGAGITFTGTNNSTLGGAGGVDVRTITVNKGTTNAAILELMPASFTVQGVNTDSAGFLTLTNGTFKISGTFAATNRVFTAAAFTIGTTTGFWLNNPNFTVAGQNGNATNSGLFRLSQGTFSQGTTNLNGFVAGTGAIFAIEGGTLNVAGRFSPSATVITYNQTGGTVNVATLGNATSAVGSFEITATTSSVFLTGGTIVLVQASTGATPIDFRISSGIALPSSTILQVGSAATAANFVFRVSGNLPNLVIDTAGGNPKSVTLFAAATMRLGNLNIPAGSTFTLNGFLLSIFTNISNAGTINGNAVGSRINFLGNTPQTYSGTGTAGTVALPLRDFGVANPAGLTVQSPMITLRVNLFNGPVNSANNVTLGVGGTSTAVVQVSQAGSTVLGGKFIPAPTWNLGSGGQVNLYLQQPAQHVTGTELNPTRTLFQLLVDNTFGLGIAGGDLTVNGNIAGAITMTNGRIATGANALYFSDTTTGTVVRTNGIVDGNFKKRFAVNGAKTFEVGTVNGYSPVDINITAGTLPADFTVRAVEGPAPFIEPVDKALQRYWSLTASGVTADLTFHYIDPIDIPPTANESLFHIYRHDAVFTDLGGTIDPVADTGFISGITQFSDWTLAEPGATPVEVDTFTVE
jgi:fibronectin type 3 domain-containing protein